VRNELCRVVQVVGLAVFFCLLVFMVKGLLNFAEQITSFKSFLPKKSNSV
jgi:hypothetical protein